MPIYKSRDNNYNFVDGSGRVVMNHKNNLRQFGAIWKNALNSVRRDSKMKAFEYTQKRNLENLSRDQQRFTAKMIVNEVQKLQERIISAKNRPIGDTHTDCMELIGRWEIKMFAEPILFVVGLVFKMVLFFIRIMVFLFKKGLGWIGIAFIIYLCSFQNQENGLQICVIIAAGGTIAHFLLRKGVHKLKTVLNKKQET